MTIIYASSNSTLCAVVETSDSDGYIASFFAAGVEITSASFPCSPAPAIAWADEVMEGEV